MFVHEFGDTAWVIREENEIIAYPFAFWSQKEPVGCIHLVGVRRAHQRRGIGKRLYDHFERLARQRGCTALKALTSPRNLPLSRSTVHSDLPFAASPPKRALRECSGLLRSWGAADRVL